LNWSGSEPPGGENPKKNAARERSNKNKVDSKGGEKNLERRRGSADNYMKKKSGKGDGLNILQKGVP